jgi:hypothetical protein
MLFRQENPDSVSLRACRIIITRYCGAYCSLSRPNPYVSDFTGGDGSGPRTIGLPRGPGLAPQPRQLALSQYTAAMRLA